MYCFNNGEIMFGIRNILIAWIVNALPTTTRICSCWCNLVYHTNYPPPMNPFRQELNQQMIKDHLHSGNSLIFHQAEEMKAWTSMPESDYWTVLPLLECSPDLLTWSSYCRPSLFIFNLQFLYNLHYNAVTLYFALWYHYFRRHDNSIFPVIPYFHAQAEPNHTTLTNYPTSVWSSNSTKLHNSGHKLQQNCIALT